MKNASNIIALVLLVMMLPLVDLLIVPICLGLIFVPVVTIPVLFGLFAIAFFHYLLIKLIVDMFSSSSK